MVYYCFIHIHAITKFLFLFSHDFASAERPCGSCHPQELSPWSSFVLNFGVVACCFGTQWLFRVYVWIVELFFEAFKHFLKGWQLLAVALLGVAQGSLMIIILIIQLNIYPINVYSPLYVGIKTIISDGYSQSLIIPLLEKTYGCRKPMAISDTYNRGTVPYKAIFLEAYPLT